jgi:hypothetical protein
MKNAFFIQVVILATVLGCSKKFDNPPYKPVNEGAKLSISALRQHSAGANSIYKFGDGDTNLYCRVSMDESSGNIYRQVFVQDDEGNGLQIRLRSSGGLNAGEEIRINLNGSYLVDANNMIYLDSIDVERSVVKLSSGNKIVSTVSSIKKILAGNGSGKSGDNFQSKVVELSGVEFAFEDRNKPFANAVGKTSYEYTLSDCTGNEIAVRTSGMSNFAAKLTPAGNGKLVAVVQQYNSEMSLIIHSYNEISMNAAACVTAAPETFTGTTYLFKDFNDNVLLSAGWSMFLASGSTSWTTSNFAENTYYARISNKIGTAYDPCESWLISPAVDLKEASDPVLTFVSANSSANSPLSLLVSTNYVSGPPSGAIWTELPFTNPKDYFKFISSGIISLSNFKSNKTRVAFRYTGTTATGSTWELDNVMLRERN